jgi:hypothetical protein
MTWRKTGVTNCPPPSRASAPGAEYPRVGSRPGIPPRSLTSGQGDTLSNFGTVRVALPLVARTAEWTFTRFLSSWYLRMPIRVS